MGKEKSEVMSGSLSDLVRRAVIGQKLVSAVR